MNVAIVARGKTCEDILAACDVLHGVSVSWVLADQADQALQTQVEKVGAKVSTSLDDIYQDASVDAVILAPSADQESFHLNKAAAHAKHVLCISPTSLQSEDAAAIQTLFQESNARVMFGNTMRFTPLFECIHRMVVENELGQIGVSRLITTRPRETSCRFDGNALRAMLEDIDTLQWFFGPATRVFTRSMSDSEDYLLATVRFRSGVIGYLESSLRHTEFRREIEVAGSDGLIRQASDETISLRLETYGSGATPSTSVQDNPFEEDPLVTQIGHFVRQVQTGKPFLISDEDALHTLDIASAMRESISSKLVAHISDR